MLRLRQNETPSLSGRRSPGAPPRLGSAVGRFMVGSLASLAIVLVGGYFALHSVAVDEATRDAKERVRNLAVAIRSANVMDGVLRGDRGDIARLDQVVHQQILDDRVVRVKLWNEQGRILYSDEPRVVGRRFELGEEERELFETRQADAELSDLSRPENRFERPFGELLEAYTVVNTQQNAEVLFETYERFSSINADGARVLRAFGPPVLAGLLVLALFQLPLAWSMARRLQRGHREREKLLASAVEASTRERQRIAADLHDGVVQDLAGVAFGLAPMATEAEQRGNDPNATALRESVDTLRQGVRDLRTLLVEIHPQSLETAGLEAALSDLLSPLQKVDLHTELHVGDGAHAKDPSDPLVYRVAREALRNVQAHSKADSVRVDVSQTPAGMRRLLVTDDGRGFAAGRREERAEEGHVGLTLLQDLVEQADGRLEVRSTPGEGTTVELEVPTR